MKRYDWNGLEDPRGAYVLYEDVALTMHRLVMAEATIRKYEEITQKLSNLIERRL